MNRKFVLGITLSLLLMAVSTLMFNFYLVKATPGSIYIRADGSVDPSTANITSADNVTYYFTDNISDEIVVERSNIIVDGAGYTLQGSGSGYGFNLTGISNVTIQNTSIKNFEYGIYLYSSNLSTISGNNVTNNVLGVYLYLSSHHTISENNITNNIGFGVHIYSSSNDNTISGNNIANNGNGIRLFQSSINTLSGNNITDNDGYGVGLFSSSNNVISGNNITNNQYYGVGTGVALSGSSNNNVYQNHIKNNDFGIVLDSSSNNTIFGNYIKYNDYGVVLESSSDNEFYHNNFINNTQQANITMSGYANIWDDGYPSGGNYWSDYSGVDYYSGSNQDQPSGDGIGDTPYVIDENNTDRYPLMNREQYDWPMIGYDPAFTSYSPSTAPNTNATAWVSDMPGGSGWSSPVIAEGKVFIGIGWTPKFTAWDEETGDFLWSFEAGGNVPTTAAVAYDMVFFGTAAPGGWIHALNVTTGEQIWNFTTEGDVRAPPVVTDGRLYIGGDLDSTGTVSCINATTGESIWNYTTQDRMTSVAVAYGKVYAGCGHWETSTKAAIYCLDMYDGSLVWSFDTGRDQGGALSVANGKVYFSASYEGSSCTVFALNATNGNQVWNTTRYSSGEAGHTAVAYGKVFISLGYSARGVYALNETNGDEIWAFPIVPEQPGPGHQNNPGGGPVIADGKVFFAWGYPGHMFYAVNETTGAVVWSYKLVGAVHSRSSAIANGRVFVADYYDKKLYAFGWPYVARIKSYCYTEESDISVGITMDGSLTGYNTPHTFTELTDTHNFTVPDTDPSGHPFKQWNTGETSTTITVNAGGTYTAYYQEKYNLTITTTTGGTTNPPPGNYSYWEGTEATVTAIPDMGYALDHWKFDGSWNYSNPITITMDSNHTLLAIFKPTYTLTITTTTAGTTDPSPGTYTYIEGTTVTVLASPYTNCEFDHWELDSSWNYSNPINVTMNYDHNLHAVFTYNVTIKAHCYTEDVGVSVSIIMDGSPTGYSTPHNFTDLIGTHNFTVPDTDPSGHLFKQWNTDETSTTITVNAGGTYTAYYQAKYNLTITTTTGGTTNPPPGNYSYWDGTEATVTAIPATHYILDHWKLDGSNVGSQNPITVTMNSNHALQAVFKYSPPPPPPVVGGFLLPVDKFGLLAPYIGLVSIIVVATVATAIYVRRVKRRKEKQ